MSKEEKHFGELEINQKSEGIREGIKESSCRKKGRTMREKTKTIQREITGF